MNYKLVPMTMEHIPQIAALEQACFTHPWSGDALREELRNDCAVVIVAEGEDGTVLGYAGLQTVLDEGYINNVAVAEPFRRQGVADELISALVRFGADRLAFLTLEVRQSNAPAIALYAKHGFREAGRRKNYYEQPREDALLMTRHFSMKLEPLTKQELTALYQSELVSDFPGSELKPLDAMLRLMDMGRYDPLRVTEGERTVGYAMVWLPTNRRGGLLEYFGVLRGLRSGGIGSRALDLLAQRYGQLFGEAEIADSDDPAENELRRRRIGFYERNGFRVLDYQCALFGVHFHCLYRGDERDDRAVEELHRGVYADYFSPAHMERYIQLPLGENETIHPAPGWVEEDGR